MDCHTWNGRDLKYFNYSNKSIQVRAQFHGLSAQDGLDLAAYIRSLAVYQSVGGRPWNPPYQPGPGLDSKPIEEWSAGAGVDFALDSDSATLNYMFPNGIPTKQGFASSGDLNAREIPVQLQFLDWNHWLPRTWPGDTYGSAFTGAPVFKDYGGIRNQFTGSPPTSANIKGYLINLYQPWQIDYGNFAGAYNAGPWTPALAQQVYDIALWKMVKEWELVHEFNMEGFGPALFGAGIGEPRGWFSGQPFQSSPNMLHIPDLDGQGIDGSALTTFFISSAWYQLQLTLWSHRFAPSMDPIDWGYNWGFLNGSVVEAHVPSAVRLAFFLAKAGQMTFNGLPPDENSGYSAGPRPFYTFDVSRFSL